MEIAAYSFPPEALLALTSATAAINSTLDSSAVFEHIAQWAATVMRAEASSVLAFDEKRNKLVFLAAVGASRTSLAGKEFDADKGIAVKVMKVVLKFNKNVKRMITTKIPPSAMASLTLAMALSMKAAC